MADKRMLKLLEASLFDPRPFMEDKPWKVSGQDLRAEALREIEPDKLLFDNCTRQEDVNKVITGYERLSRLEENGNIRLDVRTMVTLSKENRKRTLELVYSEKKVRFLCFFGTIFCAQNGKQYVPSLYRSGTEAWNIGCRLMDSEFDKDDYSVCLVPYLRVVALNRFRT